jgi:hypothetical protein
VWVPVASLLKRGLRLVLGGYAAAEPQMAFTRVMMGGRQLSLVGAAEGSEDATASAALWADHARVLLKYRIPVKTDRWDVAILGFAEVDLVSHSGNSASGEFVKVPQRWQRNECSH